MIKNAVFSTLLGLFILSMMSELLGPVTTIVGFLLSFAAAAVAPIIGHFRVVMLLNCEVGFMLIGYYWYMMPFFASVAPEIMLDFWFIISFVIQPIATMWAMIGFSYLISLLIVKHLKIRERIGGALS